MTTPATCIDAGVGTWTATFTKRYFAVQTKNVEIAALGHKLTKTEAKAASCEEAGNSEYWTCSTCGKYFSDAEGKTEIEENSWVIEATGHNWAEPTWTWKDDYSSAEAAFVCKNDETHKETVKATITGPVKGVYTATVTGPDGKTYTDTKEITVAVSNITSTSVTFEGSLKLNAYINLTNELKADPDAYIRLTFNGVTAEYRVADLVKDLDSLGRVKVTQEVLAAMMNDVMTLEIFNGKGEKQDVTYKENAVEDNSFEFTVTDYLDGRITGGTTPEMRELARVTELSGTAVQVYFGYEASDLTAEKIAEMKAEAAKITIPDSYKEVKTGDLPAGISKQSTTVKFEADNTLRIYFYFADADLNKYTFTLDGAAVKVEKDMDSSASRYYVEIANIPSGELSKVYTVSVTDGTNTYTTKASALSYAYGRQENSTNPDMKNLAKLLYLYSQAAEAYFNR